MGIKVTNKETDVETEILNRLSEIGLTIDLPEDEENSDEDDE